jgi:hypothetical protein
MREVGRSRAGSGKRRVNGGKRGGERAREAIFAKKKWGVLFFRRSVGDRQNWKEALMKAMRAIGTIKDPAKGLRNGRYGNLNEKATEPFQNSSS